MPDFLRTDCEQCHPVASRPGLYLRGTGTKPTRHEEPLLSVAQTPAGWGIFRGRLLQEDGFASEGLAEQRLRALLSGVELAGVKKND